MPARILASSSRNLKRANLAEAYFYDADLRDADLRGAVMVIGVPEGSDMTVIDREVALTGLAQYAHFRNADFGGTAVSMKWKQFIEQQGVKNFEKILWVT